MTAPLIVDSHQDLAWNMLTFGRDYTRSVAETRRLETEADSPVIRHEGHTLIGWPEYQRGRMGVVFGTLFASPARRRLGEWETLVYAEAGEAHRLYRRQLDAYHELVERQPACFRLIGSLPDLEAVLSDWEAEKAEGHPVGLVPLMEGAEGVRSPGELDEWWGAGVRIIGLAWAGTRFCGGTRDPGPLTDEGRQLLKSMAELGFALDLSHMDELSARQALDSYPGPILASHANAAALIPDYTGNRHLPDDVIRGLLQRDGVIGLLPSCKFLDYGWQRGDPRSDVPLERLAAHVDHICQLAGDARHVGLGSDFDGGYGVEAVPAELDSVADLQKLVPILQANGYNDEAVAAILGQNWLRFLRNFLPQ
jgi:membrane dipeptidase